jgi:hypothetical protein
LAKPFATLLLAAAVSVLSDLPARSQSPSGKGLRRG